MKKKKPVSLYDKEPLAFAVRQTHTIYGNDGKPQNVVIVGGSQDDYELPQGSFSDIVITYRWFSDYRQYWLYAVTTDRSLSYQIRYYRQSVTNEKRKQTIAAKKAAK